MTIAYQQGNADGLCGIYALLNFLQSVDEWGDTPQETLWYLLDAVRHFGWLNPYTLVHGFEGHQLQTILDMQIRNYFLPYQTFLLPDVVRSVKFSSTKDLVKRITKRGGSIITGPKSKEHWFLVSGRSGEVIIIDSSDSGRPVASFDAKSRIDIDGYGVVILPHEIEKIQVDI